MDFSAGAGTDLFLRVFLAGFSNQRIDRTARNFACRRLLARGRATAWAGGLLVCADAALDLKRAAHADGTLLGGDDCVGAAGFEFVATGNVGDLFCVFSFVCERGAGFLVVSIGWNVAGGGIHFPVFCAKGMAARMGRGESAFANELVFAGLGMFSHLLRVGRGKNHGRGSGVEEFHSA